MLLVKNRQILSRIPKTHRARARAVLARIRAKPQEITFNPDTLQVILKGEEIAHTNFIDLFTTLFTKRKARANLPGKQLFASAIRKINVPITDVINRSLNDSDRDFYLGKGKGHPTRKNNRAKRISHHQSGPPGKHAKILKLY